MNHPTSPLAIILAAAAALAHIGCGDATPRHAEHLSSTADDLAVAPIKDYIVNNCPSQPTGIGGVSVVIDVCDPQWTCACPTDDDDSDDDAPALQCWIDLAADEAEQAGGHAVLRLPADALYHVAAQGDDPTWKTALLLRSRMTIRTKGRRAPATIKLKDNQDRFKAIFGSINDTYDQYALELYDSWLVHLTIDGNGAGNPIRPSAFHTAAHELGGHTAIYMHPRTSDRTLSENVGIIGVNVINHNGVWAFHSSHLDDVCIANNNITVATASNHEDLCIQGGELTLGDLSADLTYCGDKDRRQMYVYGYPDDHTPRTVLIKDNNITADAPGYIGTRTGIETHGGDITVVNNTITNLAKGMNIANETNDGAHHDIRENTITGAMHGITLWSMANNCYSWQTNHDDDNDGVADSCLTHQGVVVPWPPLPTDRFDVTIADNDITLDPEPWRNDGSPDALTFRPTAIGLAGLSGLTDCIVGSSALCFRYGHFGTVNITSNSLTFADVTTVAPGHDIYSAAISLYGTDHELDIVAIDGNTIIEPLGNGLYVNANVGDLTVANNVFENVGQSAAVSYGPDSGIFIASLPTPKGGGTVISASIHHNCFRDNQTPTTMGYGIYAGALSCVGPCDIFGNAVVGQTADTAYFVDKDIWGKPMADPICPLAPPTQHL